jgi:hypothetical protein
MKDGATRIVNARSAEIWVFRLALRLSRVLKNAGLRSP